MCELVHHADFREREWTVEVSFAQYANVLGVEAVESSDNGYGDREGCFGDGHGWLLARCG